MNHNALIINPKDNVAVVLEDIKIGDIVTLPDGRQFPSLTEIPYGHKMAIADLKQGESVIKYGESIGELKSDAKKGEWIHIHNVVIEEEI